MVRNVGSRNPVMARPRFSLAPLYPKKYITGRQADCLIALLETQGGTRQDIAKRMGISPRTVEYHITVAKEKLECRSKKELVYKAQGLPWRNWMRELG